MIQNLINKLRDINEVDVSGVSDSQIEEAITIRLVEQTFLDFFAAGKMSGTVHTCVGQEFSAVAVAGQLFSGDWVTSNHRCHGHFISKTKNWRGLVDELMGLKSGVCMGLGSSQHLYADGFISNGPQGALVPVASGIAQYFKFKEMKNISVSYIGEGTLGEGVIYESMNYASLNNLSHLVVCENNYYSQSTPQIHGVSGDILNRARSFGIKVFKANTWNLKELFEIAKDAISYVRQGKPGFLLIETYRLNAHSKGDDDRSAEEKKFFSERDPINILMSEKKWVDYSTKILFDIKNHIEESAQQILSAKEYMIDQLPRSVTATLTKVDGNEKLRVVDCLNSAYKKTLENGAFHLGEDIVDPYGGAFKVTKGFSTKFPLSVQSTPISEAAIVGVAIGMSIMGVKTYVEIMFGDFLTHCFDQIISNASKFHHMYAFNVNVPIRVRTPMGGKRGYGPTHSQSLEKFFVGIDNVAVLAINSLINPKLIIDETEDVKCPILIIENKIDYGNYLWSGVSHYQMYREKKAFGSLLISPTHRQPTMTLVSYGESCRALADNLEKIFYEVDEIPELICLIQLSPIDINLIKRSVLKTRKLVIIEEGSKEFGIGSEIISRLTEDGVNLDLFLRVSADSIPIPSIRDLEDQVLPTIEKIIKSINHKKKDLNHD